MWWWWNDAFGCFFSLLLLLWILATFSACCCRGFCCCCCWSSDGNTPWKKSPPGSKTPCLWRTEKPQNCTPKMPNVTSETDRKWFFWLLFPLTAAMNFEGRRSPGKCLTQLLKPIENDVMLLAPFSSCCRYEENDLCSCCCCCCWACCSDCSCC